MLRAISNMGYISRNYKQSPCDRHNGVDIDLTFESQQNVAIQNVATQNVATLDELIPSIKNYSLLLNN